MNEQIPGFVRSIEEDKSRTPYFDTENIRFQQHLIEPKSESRFPLLTRDVVLGNINQQILDQINDRLSIATQLINYGFNNAADDIYSDCMNYIVTSRSLNGWQQEILIKSIIQKTGHDTVISEQKNADQKKGFFSLFRKPK